MSGAISNGYGIMPTLMRSIDKLNAQNDALTAQGSSGVLSGSYAGLGDQADEAISLEPQISATAAWQTNVSQTQTKLSVTQTALQSITSIATSLQTTLISLQSTLSSTAISTASSIALQQLTALTSLLNTRSGDSYVFAGQASDQAPISYPDLAKTPLVSSIVAAVALVGPATTTGAVSALDTEQATLASMSFSATTGTVFSGQLSDSTVSPATLVPQIQVGQNATISTGVVATQDGAGSATGSSIRDLIRSLATVAGLSGAANNGTADFQSLISYTSGQMTAVTQGLSGLTASVGALQDNAATLGSSLSDMHDALTSQLDAVKGSDPATTRTQQVAVQNQLTASYTLIADMRNLNLAQYL